MDYTDGNVMLMLGDCIERMSDIKPKSVNAIITDLPYGTTKCKWDTVINLTDFWSMCDRVLVDNGVVVLTAQTPFDKVLGYSNLSMLKYEWIWEKTAATGHLNAKKMPMKAHENVLIFYKKLPVYNPQMTHGHSPVHSYTKKDDADGECYGRTVSVSGGGSTSRYPRSVLKFSSDKQKSSLHPTQKPLSLMEYMVKTYTNEGDVVLDATMGSGTTGVASKLLGRQFIGIEMDEGYFEVAKNRILNA